MAYQVLIALFPLSYNVPASVIAEFLQHKFFTCSEPLHMFLHPEMLFPLLFPLLVPSQHCVLCSSNISDNISSERTFLTMLFK